MNGLAVVIDRNDVPDVLPIELGGYVFNVPDTEQAQIALASRSYEQYGAELQIGGVYVIADRRVNE